MREGISLNSTNGWVSAFSMPGAFKLDHLLPFKPILFWEFSVCLTFILGGHFLLPQRDWYWERGVLPIPEMNETGGFQCLGPSNWTTCIPLSHFCSGNFQFFSPLYWEANSYYPRGLIMGVGRISLSQYGWDWGVSVPGAFEMDHLQPFKPLLFWKISNSFTFILWSQFLFPQRANNGSWEICPFPIWISLRGLSAWGIQTGPLAAL